MNFRSGKALRRKLDTQWVKFLTQTLSYFEVTEDTCDKWESYDDIRTI